MALSRRFLTALGIEEEKVEEIINAHSETVTALKKERDDAREQSDKLKADTEQYKAEAKKVPELEKKVAELEKAAEDYEKENGADAWKLKYEAMVEERDSVKAEFDKFKSETSEKETKAAKEKAYRALLKEAGVSEKRIDSVVKVTDLEKVELDKDGNIKGKDDHINTIKEDWADFIATTTQTGASTATPPANTGGSTKTKEEIMAIKDRAERQKAIADNPKLFGLEE